MAHVGQEIRRVREERGLNQAQLAVVVGTGPAAISRIENGRQSPNTETLERIARALGVEAGDLFPKEQSRLPFEDGERPKVEDIELARRFKQWEKDLEEFQASHGDYQGIIDKVAREMHQTAEELRGQSA
jgi:transcriptional regulator with XRE-family HTH domain